MTLIVTINGREAIWLLADRRLSYKHRAPKDDARKVMFLETTDGTAIIGYAGLGATAHGTEPADWMSAVLRGRNLPLEQSLGVLADAMKRQLPQHMAQMPTPGETTHNTLITAFVGSEVRYYTIYLVFAPDRKSYQFRYTRHVANNRTSTSDRAPRFGAGGTGGIYLARDRRWMRPLLRLVRAYDRGQVPPHLVADHLARLNSDVYLGVSDKSVGPRCIVAWRNKKGGIYKGGGGHNFYTDTARDSDTLPLPDISNGTDWLALVNVPTLRMSKNLKNFEAIRAGESAEKLDTVDLNEELARLPNKPDEKLR